MKKLFSKEVLVSFLKSFVAQLITALALAVSILPDGTILNPEFWKAGGALALLGACIRSALSETYKRVATEKFGGKRK